MRHALTLLFVLFITLLAQADDVPAVETDAEELKLNLKSVLHACNDIQPWKKHNLSTALIKQNSLEMQEAIDSHVAFVVTVNPESRVKVHRGPAYIRLDQGWQNAVLVKVINEGGISSKLQLRIHGPKHISARLYEFRSFQNANWMLTNKLSGRIIDYRLIVLTNTLMGKHEVTFSFDAGQETQDLGFRAEVAALLHTEIGEKPFYRDHQQLLYYIDHRGLEIKFHDVDSWQKYRRKDILDRVQSVMGNLPAEHPAKVNTRLLEERVIDGISIKKIQFQTDRDWVPAILLTPVSNGLRMPAMLCLHQTTAMGKNEPVGIGGKDNLHYAIELAKRGYVTLAPDYPGFGDYKHCNSYVMGFDSTTLKGIVNHRIAVTLLTDLPTVDAERIGCIGHSLGGHNALFAGMFDERIKVVATSCGFCSFPKYFGGNLKGWSHQGYMPRIATVYSCDPKQMPFDFTEILGVLAPRAVFINAPLRDDNFNVEGVRDCIRAAKPVFDLYGKPGQLQVEYPDAGHDFPQDVRNRCYQFLDLQLKSR